MTAHTLAKPQWQIDGGNHAAVEVRPGRRLSVQTFAGAADSDTTIFLCHGAGGNRQQWRQQWQDLQRRGHRLVAWDLLGHGKSARPKRAEAYTGRELVEDYQALLDSHGSARNILVAHSYGARLTLALLLQLESRGQLQRVERCLLLGAQAPGATFASGLLRLPVWLLTLLRPKLEKGFRQLAWHAGADPALIDREERVARGNSLRVFKALTTQLAIIDPQHLARLHLPISLLAGDSDGLTPAEGARQLAALLPDAELRVFERCGHQIMLERAAETSEELLRFISAGSHSAP